MSWRPKNETHAIERMSVGINFRQPISYELIEKFSREIVKNHEHLGFNYNGPIQATTFELVPEVKIVGKHQGTAGIVLRRNSESTKVEEELGFRDKMFFYTTLSYERWSSTKSRLQSILLPVVTNAAKKFDIQSIRLEYWDNFIYDGEPQKADVSKILNKFQMVIPQNSLKGEAPWQSLFSWYEELEPEPTLIRQAFNTSDKVNQDDSKTRILDVYSLVEKFLNNAVKGDTEIIKIIDKLHMTSLRIFSEVLSKNFHKRVSID